MRAVELQFSDVRYVADFAEPTVPAGETLVQVLMAGICETDLQLMQGYMGFHGILGHEFVGVATSGRFAGQRVAGEINCSCGTCDFCQRGLPTHCPERSVLGILNRNGAFAERLVLPEANLHPIPDEITDEEAVFVEPVAAAFQILEQVTVDPNQPLIVLGDGRLGNLSAQVLAAHGADVRVVGKHPEKLEILDALKIKTCLLADADALKSVDLVVDCTGSPSGLETALRLVRPRGTVVLKTTVAAPHSLSLAPVVIDELTVIGSRCGPFAPAIQALAQRRIDVRPLISETIRLEDTPDALARATRQPVMKILIDLRSP